MTFGEPTWNCFKTTFFGILFMLFVETWLVLEEVDIPVWILPCHTTAGMLVIVIEVSYLMLGLSGALETPDLLLSYPTVTIQ